MLLLRASTEAIPDSAASSADDFWDPRAWPEDLFTAPRRIWDPHIEHAALVDDDDYDYLSQWKWNVKMYRGRPYMRRAVGNRCYGPGGVQTVYLHLEVASRARLRRPSSRHSVLDHINWDSLDNRRANLRWATMRQNALNVANPWWKRSKVA